MSTIRRIAKNTTCIALAEILTKFFIFISTILIARYLEVAGFGIYSFAFSITVLVAILSDLGLNTLFIREIARNSKLAKIYFNKISLIKSILSLIAFIILVIIMNIAKYPLETKMTVYIAGIYIIITSFNQLFRAVFRAFEKMEYELATRIIEEITQFILILLMIQYELGLIGIAIAYLAASAIIFAITAIIIAKKFNELKISISIADIMDINPIKDLLKSALPFGLTTFFVMIYFQISIILLSIMKGDSVVGWYNAAYKIIFGLMFLPHAFIYSVFPIMSRYCGSSQESFRKLYLYGFKCLLAISIPISVIGFIFANKIIILFYDTGYEESINALRILILITPIIFLTVFFGPTLQANDKQMIVAYVAASNALFNIILNLILIPSYSYIGASIATVLTEALGYMLMIHYISKSLAEVESLYVYVKPLISGIAVSIFIYYFIDWINWIILSIIGIILYFLFLVSMGYISKEDKELFKKLFAMSRGAKNKAAK